MELQGKRAAVLVEQMYQELEVWYPVYRLREAGCKVTLVGPDAGQTYPSKLGYPAKSDEAASEVSADDFDILIIPGGYAPDHMQRWQARHANTEVQRPGGTGWPPPARARCVRAANPWHAAGTAR